MISRLEVRRFKCFSRLELRVGALTLLVGSNASGKSSVLQALLLLRQSFERGRSHWDELALNGTYTSVGMARDALNVDSDERAVGFSLWESQQEVPAVFEFGFAAGREDVYYLRSTVPVSYPQTPLFTHPLRYLQAERVGPQLLYPMTEFSDSGPVLGAKGEFTAHCLAELGQEPIRNRALAYPGSEAEGLLSLAHQTRVWMRQVLGVEIDFAVEKIGDADQVKLTLTAEAATKRLFRPTNTGFGISYALPIVVAGLLSEEGATLLVENPEAHLHPRGQSEIGKFLCRVASAGVQVMVETHSDHVLNGARVSVKNGVMVPQDVTVLFFTRDPDTREHVAKSLSMDDKGRIPRWPPGFFDQLELDLAELALGDRR